MAPAVRAARVIVTPRRWWIDRNRRHLCRSHRLGRDDPFGARVRSFPCMTACAQPQLPLSVRIAGTSSCSRRSGRGPGVQPQLPLSSRTVVTSSAGSGRSWSSAPVAAGQVHGGHLLVVLPGRVRSGLSPSCRCRAARGHLLGGGRTCWSGSGLSPSCRCRAARGFTSSVVVGPAGPDQPQLPLARYMAVLPFSSVGPAGRSAPVAAAELQVGHLARSVVTEIGSAPVAAVELHGSPPPLLSRAGAPARGRGRHGGDACRRNTPFAGR